MGREASAVCCRGGGWRGGACHGGGGLEEGREAELGLEEQVVAPISQVNSLAAHSLEGRNAENPLHHGASLFPDAWPGMFFPLDLWGSWLWVCSQPSWDRSLPPGGRGQDASLNPVPVQGPKARGPAQA